MDEKTNKVNTLKVLFFLEAFLQYLFCRYFGFMYYFIVSLDK